MRRTERLALEDEDPKTIEHDPGEVAPNRQRHYSVSPWWVLSIIAILLGIQVQQGRYDHIHGWMDWTAGGLFALFCLWNYWPRGQR